MDLGASAYYNDNPVFLDTVYNIGVNKIGYIVYNAFDSNYDDGLKAAFRRIKDKGATDMIVDLRYNGGGYINSSQLLASMIVPPENLAAPAIYATGRYNADLTAKGRKETFKFEKDAGTDNLNLANLRVYILTGMWTASASELLINGLAPYMQVRYMGTKTEGKNVGSYEIVSEYNMTLHPITMQIYNVDGDSENYRNGFIPAGTDLRNELDFSSEVQLNMRELGDINEYLLRYAVAEITGVQHFTKASYPDSRSGAAVQGGQVITTGKVEASSLDRKPLKGMIVNSEEIKTK